jgi:Protein of unknown function with HXXEE motif
VAILSRSGQSQEDVRRGWRGLWPLLFPVTYLVHFAEETWGGFVPWSARYLGFHLTVERFLGLNAVAWVGMLILGIAASLGEKTRWLVVPLATAVLLNGVAHLGASLATGIYSPGVISGVVLWVPLGAIVLRRAWLRIRHGVWPLVALGVLLQLAVTSWARSQGP